jgi:hypothetical protein
VAAGSSDVCFRLQLEPKTWWLTVPLHLAGQFTLDMVLDTGSPLSGISYLTRDVLARQDLLVPVGPRRYLLRDLTIENQPIPDLVVRLSQRASAVGIDGMLGLDFLNRFSDIHLNVPTLWLTLRL